MTVCALSSLIDQECEGEDGSSQDIDHNVNFPVLSITYNRNQKWSHYMEKLECYNWIEFNLHSNYSSFVDILLFSVNLWVKKFVKKNTHFQLNRWWWQHSLYCCQEHSKNITKCKENTIFATQNARRVWFRTIYSITMEEVWKVFIKVGFRVWSLKHCVLTSYQGILRCRIFTTLSVNSTMSSFSCTYIDWLVSDCLKKHDWQFFRI